MSWVLPTVLISSVSRKNPLAFLTRPSCSAAGGHSAPHLSNNQQTSFERCRWGCTVGRSNRRKLKQLGRYQILGELGSGGMSTVYRAVPQGASTHVALKVTPVDNSIDVEISDYQREVMMGRRLRHPHIVSPIDHGCRDGFIYLAMPIIDGATLSNATRLRDPSRRPSSSRSSAYNDAWVVPLLEGQWERLVDIGCQLASALEACHAAGIIHRDIKPGNVMMDRDARVYLMDFGLAWMRRGPVGLKLETRDGTARYLPPEVFDGRRDERSDVYSLGLTMHELATGRKVWGEVDHEVIREDRPDYEVPEVRSMRSDVPQELADCIDKACSENPDERHPSATALREHFQLLRERASGGLRELLDARGAFESCRLSQVERPVAPYSLDGSWFEQASP